IFVQGGRDLDAALTRLGLAASTLTLLGGHGNVDASTGGHFTVSYADFQAQLAAATAPAR
ncbi:MAG TPA: hypothetical protein VFS00_35220, partial [Polyangiaceae bacterium]|nr:hypothetical protein [Polyangiaceae bacterium]